jgi:hypothetical protein
MSKFERFIQNLSLNNINEFSGEVAHTLQPANLISSENLSVIDIIKIVGKIAYTGGNSIDFLMNFCLKIIRFFSGEVAHTLLLIRLAGWDAYNPLT